MPLLNSGAQRCALRTGTYTVGGSGADALPIASLEWCPAVATIIVPPSGPSTIQRLAASVVVRVDRVALGVAPKPLNDGAHIEFEGCCLTFATDDVGERMITSASSGSVSDSPVRAEPAVPAHTSTVHARIVKLRTGDAIELGNYRVVVGRDAACDFVVSGMGVSRRHFSVTPVEGGYLLRDESANGTLVNGSRVSGTYLLGHGDVLRLDEEDLRYEVEGVSAPVPSAEAAPTQILDMSRLRREFAAGAKREQAPPTPLMANLEIVRGAYAGASFPIDRPVCSIGRGPQNDVRVRDESVSTSHATLLRKGTTWFVVDLRSANGTFVNGLRVAGERELTPGSRLKLGSVEMVFRSLSAGIDAPIAKKRKRWWLDLLRPFRRASPTVESD